MSDPFTTVLVPLGEPEGRERWLVEHEGRSYAVFVVAGSLVVTDALCPHRQAPLVEGIIRDGAVVCPGHWYAFDLGTGACRTTGEVSLPRHRVVSVDGTLFVEVPERVVPLSWSERLRAHAVERGPRTT